MYHVAARSEVIRRIFAGDLPLVGNFVVFRSKTGEGACRGCGLTLAATEPRCVIDCAKADFGPFSMHAGCFHLWSEACMCMSEREDRDVQSDGTGGETRAAGSAHSAHTLKSRDVFCVTRMELLGSCVHEANDFAEAVRRMSRSRSTGARAACEQARSQSRQAFDTYRDHIEGHGCHSAAGR